VFVRIGLVTELRHLSVAVKVPDVDFVFFDDFLTGRPDYKNDVVEGNDDAAGFEQGLGLEPPEIQGAQRLEELRHLISPMPRHKPGDSGVLLVVFPNHIVAQVTQDGRNVAAGERCVDLLNAGDIAHGRLSSLVNGLTAAETDSAGEGLQPAAGAGSASAAGITVAVGIVGRHGSRSILFHAVPWRKPSERADQ